MKKVLLLAIIGMVCMATNILAQPNIFDPNDPVINYDTAHPPALPPSNTMTKWVRTVRLSWNTNKFKAYYWNNMAFRLRFPNGYNPADPNKKYPLILFFHGGGEIDTATDNEYHLLHGAQLFEQMMDA